MPSNDHERWDGGSFIAALGTTGDFTTETQAPVVFDPLDDVFGSAPASPALEAQDARDTDSGTQSTASRSHILDPSDIPRLRSTHVTNGYREGVAASKDQHIQQGFDDGYSVGAELGLKAGWIVGVLRGVHAAIRTERRNTSSEGSIAAEEEQKLALEAEVHHLLREAADELKPQRLLDQQYFGTDGLSVYEIQRHDDDTGETTSDQVAASHPIVLKWLHVVQELSLRLGLDLQ